MNTKTTISAIVMFAAVLGMVSFAPAFAASTPTLGAPANLSCTIDTDGDVDSEMNAIWDDLSGATKYSVEITAHYSTHPDQVFKYSVTASELLDISVDDFDSAIDTDADTVPDSFEDATSADVAVKGLSSPGKSQNNPFASYTCDESDV